ncbi:YlbE-like family protein [Peribacillus sp. SCS-155]|uniref:YlbE-like family protein n=1 Tax=Peribacillus sedimenti TaxID=3115297 RepID=UPI003906A422
MRQDILVQIQADPDLKNFIRMQPQWYRYLMRHPHQLDKMQTEAAYFLKKSIPHRISNLSNGVQMAWMMLNMYQAMNSNSQS